MNYKVSSHYSNLPNDSFRDPNDVSYMQGEGREAIEEFTDRDFGVRLEDIKLKERKKKSQFSR